MHALDLHLEHTGGFLRNVGRQELDRAVEELDIAIRYQARWYGNLNRKLVCRMPPPNIRDMSKNAHHLCEFGAWYDMHEDREISQHPLFEKIGRVHRKVHRLATRLLSRVADNEPIPLVEYESFRETEKHLRRALHSLKRDIKSTIGNVGS